MSKAEKKLRSFLSAADWPSRDLALAMYARCGDLQTITSCQEWAEILRAVADAVERDYGTGANK